MTSSLSPEPVSLSAAPALPAARTATESLYRAALAEGDIGFYLPVFARFDEQGVARPHWNPAAALLNLNWLLYRRLWRAAALHGMTVGVLALALWWTGPSLGALGPLLWLGLLAVAIAVPGFWGTAWLHEDLRRRMTAEVRRARTVQEACDALQRQDRRRTWLWGAAVLQAVLFLRVGLDASWLAVPAEVPPTQVMAEDPTAAEPVETGLTPTVEPPPMAVPPSVAVLPAAPAAPAEPQAAASAEPMDSTVRPRLRGHGVNVGMFSDPANAERARQRLAEAGLPVVVDQVESARGTLTRVRVGPFDDGLAARKAADQVRAAGLEARVFAP